MGGGIATRRLGARVLAAIVAVVALSAASPGRADASYALCIDSSPAPHGFKVLGYMYADSSRGPGGMSLWLSKGTGLTGEVHGWELSAGSRVRVTRREATISRTWRGGRLDLRF